jgi:hypothetical protein
VTAVSTAAEIFAEPHDWLFWRPSRLRVGSAWVGHIPFAHWLVVAARPRLVVELGTYRGASYGGFCEAVLRGGQPTKCFAVDTWTGDDHAGHYGDQVYDEFLRFNERRYGRFSTALRMTFDDAAGRFADGTIDLLHIDGYHTYEAVRHDFETWRPKLSDRALVLFHDTAEREADFGVWKLWEELRGGFAGFEFLHSHGLGVLRVGSTHQSRVQALFDLESKSEVAKVRASFASLGEAVRRGAQAWRLRAESNRLKAELGLSGQDIF